MSELVKVEQVVSVFYTDDPSCLAVHVILEGELEECVHYLRDDDEYGNSPFLRQWIEENNPNIMSYTPPDPLTPEEVRSGMPSLTPRQFRDALIDADIMPDQVTAAINQIPDDKQRAKALNAWEYPAQFIRTDPLIDQIGEFFNLTPEDIDNMWVGVLG